MTRIGFAPLLVSLLLLHQPASARAQDSVRTERIQFKRGATSASVKGHIKGYQVVDYLVGARQGQSMNASLASRNTATYFNILPPGSKDEAIFNGSISENQFEGTLPASGDYRLRVYMMRSAARRNEVADYGLEVIISGPGVQSESHDAKVPGTNYHATGTTPCSQGKGQPTSQCPFGVVRHGQGSADVTITLPDGRKRVIFFKDNKVVGFDKSQAGPQTFGATMQSDLYIVTVGEERYEIPDAIVNGG